MRRRGAAARALLEGTDSCTLLALVVTQRATQDARLVRETFAYSASE